MPPGCGNQPKLQLIPSTRPPSLPQAPCRRRRQIDQISGRYRSTSAPCACLSPFLALVTRPVTD
jgi:hypothetical protein